MAKKKARRWVWVPKKPPKPRVPEALKAEVETKGRALVEGFFKPKFIEPRPKDPRWNFIVDIGSRWYRSFFYFYSVYECPGPNALEPSFESPFARMEYVGGDRFNLAYMRHTGKWWELFQGLTVDESLKTIREMGHFQP
jgi:hypothetical protein